jgi:peptidoglycan/LPS O-acetylase OafA/YrhL
MPHERSSFRPDVEGLRGVAILLVVLFHAGVPALAGGFVGVDVFFVLSGYFITALLVREWSRSGELRLGDFYGRRALRLLPPLLLVLLTTLAAVMWLYAPIDRAAIAGDASSVALYAGNYAFARGAVDYFGAGANPLLHTWSLAVEEQFYLVWPLLFLLVSLLAGARQRADARDDATRPLLASLALLGVLSFIASVWLTRVSQPWAFFGMPTRIWEFALGGALAVIWGWTEQSGGARRETRATCGSLLQAGALVALVFAVAAYDRMTPYPGVAALAPALAALALLIGGQWSPDGVISRALSLPPLRWLGRLSYAWYLWHWPLVGLGAVLARDIGVGGRLAWSGVALMLAWATWRFMERPAREGRLSRLSPAWLATLALFASLGAALLARGAMRVAQRQAARPDQRAFAAARNDRMQHECWANSVDDATLPCVLGDVRSSRTIALLGDSHAEHWLGALDRAGRERGWKIDAMVMGGCPVAELPELMHVRLKRQYAECTRYREAMIRRIISLRPSAVILSSWDHYVSSEGASPDWQVTPETWRRGLRRTYARLTAAGLRVVVVRGTPRTWFDVPACLSRRAARLPFADECSYAREASLNASARAAQDAAARGLPIRFLDMNDQICAAPRCGVMHDGLVIFTDDNHLTASFSRSMAPVFGDRLATALGWMSGAPRSSRTDGSMPRRAASILSASLARRLR